MIEFLRRLLLRIRKILGAVMAPAADPRQTFAHTYERQRMLLVQVQRALHEITLSKNQLEIKMSNVKGKLPQMEEQARRSLKAGRDDLARLALRRYQVAMVELRNMEGQLLEIQEEEQRLSIEEERLTTRIEGFFARQEILAAQYSAVEARVRTKEALTGVSRELEEFGLALQRAEQKTADMQSRAVAIDRLVDAGVLNGSSGGYMETEFDDADLALSVEEHLEALKQTLIDDHQTEN